MSLAAELDAAYMLWLREVKRFLRLRSRIAGSLGMPFFFLLFLGLAPFDFPGAPQGYINFLTPGIMGMILLFASMGAGTSVLWDKEFGFLKEIMVAPIRRASIVLGKTAGGITTALIQGFIILFLAIPLGLKLKGFFGTGTPGSIALGVGAAIPFMILIGITFVGLGLAFASRMEDIHGFQLVWNFLVFPTFLLSGALFPIDIFPSWLRCLALANPLTYGVDALRGCLTGFHEFPLKLDLLVLSGSSILTISLGAFLFGRMEVR